MKFLIFLIKTGLTNKHILMYLSSFLLSLVFLFTAFAIVVALAEQDKFITTIDSYDNFSSNNNNNNNNKTFLRKKKVVSSPSTSLSFSSFDLYNTKDNVEINENHAKTMYASNSLSGTFSK